MPLRCSLRTAGVTWGWRSWEPLASNGGHAARGRLQRCVFGREVRLGAWRGVQGKGTLGCVRLLRMLTKNFFSSSSSHRPCACAGASLIYPKLDYTLLLLPILYCVNRAPPENRMIMRFLPFHFCNPLQTDVNRLQSDAFQLQLRAFWMHLRVTSLRPTCTWMRGGCNGKFARIRAWAMENAAVEIRPGKLSATESSGKKYSPMLAAVPRAWGLFVH